MLWAASFLQVFSGSFSEGGAAFSAQEPAPVGFPIQSMLLSRSALLANLMLKRLPIVSSRFQNLSGMQFVLWHHSLLVEVLKLFEQVEILDSMNVLFVESHLLSTSQET